MDCHLSVYLKLHKTVICCLLFSARIAAKSAKQVNSYSFQCKELNYLRYLVFFRMVNFATYTITDLEVKYHYKHCCSNGQPWAGILKHSWTLKKSSNTETNPSMQSEIINWKTYYRMVCLATESYWGLLCLQFPPKTRKTKNSFI